MLFLVGTQNSNIKNGTISNENCLKCGTKNTLDFSIYRKYVHITQIPLFPVGKLVSIQCNYCEENFDYEDLSENSQLQLRKEKLDHKIWMFSGSILILLVIIYTINNYANNQKETDTFIKTPTVGDIYNLKFSNGYYSTMKIDKVTKDSVYTTHNDFNAYLPNEIDDLDKTENYSNREVSYSKKELMDLYKNDEIIKIRRSKYPIKLQEPEYKIPLTQ
ncbi:hypothetical protein [Flavobacterium sp. T12S277]|uniref:hypothetical protein n=1 Tax=Flavobacterium sp. T12S277 TaxID=3402752 RepID=UPI003AE7CEEF